MALQHIVRQGDTIAKLADQYGFFCETIWNHPENRGLKERRGDMNVLFPGDVVMIPDKQSKSVPVQAGQGHRFRRRGVPMRLRLQLFNQGVPLANRSYKLTIDDLEITGVTDKEGFLERYISPRSEQGRVCVEEEHAWLLQFGHMDPADTLSGIQKRLQNLGYDPGDLDGKPSRKTREALLAFQRRFGLPASGEPDDSTQKKLQEIYESFGSPTAHSKAYP